MNKLYTVHQKQNYPTDTSTKFSASSEKPLWNYVVIKYFTFGFFNTLILTYIPDMIEKKY